MLDLHRIAEDILSATSAAAVDRLTTTIPPGESWLLVEVVASHTDPAGATVFWVIGDADGHEVVIDVGALAANIRTRLSPTYPLPVWLPADWTFRIQSAAALAAGKTFTVVYHCHKVKGLLPGLYT
jgi:hypothetical protein